MTDVPRTLLICLAISIAWAGTATMLILGGQSHLSAWLARIDALPIVSVTTEQSLRPSVAGAGRARVGQPLYALRLSFKGNLNGANGVVSGLATATLRYGARSSILTHRVESGVYTIADVPDDVAPATPDPRPLPTISPAMLREELARLGAGMPEPDADRDIEQELELLSGLLQDFLARPMMPPIASHPLNESVQFQGDAVEPLFITYEAAPEFHAARRLISAALTLLSACVLAYLWAATWRALRPARGMPVRERPASHLPHSEAAA